jgi:Ca2+/Na+ antiporter
MNIGVGIGVAALIFSLYQLFISRDAIASGIGALRVVVVLLGVVALHFEDPTVWTVSVFLYSIVCIFVLALTRNEVQIRK